MLLVDAVKGMFCRLSAFKVFSLPNVYTLPVFCFGVLLLQRIKFY
jgi:hypothetical protein